MRWQKKDKYYIQSGEWTIAKYWLNEVPKYGLWNLNTNHGYFDTANDAKAKAEELNK